CRGGLVGVDVAERHDILGRVHPPQDLRAPGAQPDHRDIQFFGERLEPQGDQRGDTPAPSSWYRPNQQGSVKEVAPGKHVIAHGESLLAVAAPAGCPAAEPVPISRAVYQLIRSVCTPGEKSGEEPRRAP